MTVVAQTNQQSEQIPKNCQELKEITTNQTHIRKKIDSVGRKNYNADFAVPAGEKFTSFKAVMLPENDATYGVTINLKYGDQSVSTALQKNVQMKRGETYTLPFQSSTEKQPYQVNFNISGANNNAYTISLMACK
ncbi:hypothetical protein [Aphanothece hegewaldii]|nr:hypothetical protein [Aphanothece hegewaldii]